MKKLFVATLISMIPLVSLAQQQVPPEIYQLKAGSTQQKFEIRAEPNQRATILREVDYNPKGFEIIEIREGWGKINNRELSGWINMNELTRGDSAWADGKLPASVHCSGVGTYWDVLLKQQQLRLKDNNNAAQTFAITAVEAPSDQKDGLRIVRAGNVALTIQSQACNDTHSDREYGLSAVLNVSGHAQPTRKGCCSIAP